VQYTARLLTKYAVNGVLDINDIKVKNPVLCGVLIRNKKAVRRSLKEEGIDLYDPMEGKDYDKLKVRLKMFIGSDGVLNLTKLRVTKYWLYRRILEHGPPSEVAKDMGFIVTYSYMQKEDELITEVFEFSDENNIITDIYYGNKKLYERVLYQAYKVGMDVREYLLSKGLGLIKGGTKKSTLLPREVYALRVGNDPHSWSEIAKEAGVSVAMVRKAFARYTEEIEKLKLRGGHEDGSNRDSKTD
jgi:hypothetical protein